MKPNKTTVTFEVLKNMLHGFEIKFTETNKNNIFIELGEDKKLSFNMYQSELDGIATIETAVVVNDEVVDNPSYMNNLNQLMEFIITEKGKANNISPESIGIELLETKKIENLDLISKTLLRTNLFEANEDIIDEVLQKNRLVIGICLEMAAMDEAKILVNDKNEDSVEIKIPFDNGTSLSFVSSKDLNGLKEDNNLKHTFHCAFITSKNKPRVVNEEASFMEMVELIKKGSKSNNKKTEKKNFNQNSILR